MYMNVKNHGVPYWENWCSYPKLEIEYTTGLLVLLDYFVSRQSTFYAKKQREKFIYFFKNLHLHFMPLL